MVLGITSLALVLREILPAIGLLILISEKPSSSIYHVEHRV